MSIAATEVETAVETFAETPGGRLWLVVERIVRNVTRAQARKLERKRKPRRVVLAMNDHLLRDIGLRRSDLHRESREHWWSGEHYGDFRDD